MLKKSLNYFRNNVDRTNAFCLMSVFFATMLIFSNIVAGNLIDVIGIVFPAAVLVFPITYILGDAITELFGFKKMRLLVVFTLIVNLLIAGLGYVMSIMPHPEYFEHYEEYNLVFAVAPRIVLASSAGFLFGSLLNAFIMHVLKKSVKFNKYIWIRIILSTIIGEFVDSSLFIIIAFWGAIPLNELVILLISQYVFKVLYELIFSPLLVLILRKTRKCLDKHSSNDIFKDETSSSQW